MSAYDFSGWATRNDIRCSDGRTIRKDAFKGCDGLTVPLVWNHQHNDPENVLGYATLENTPQGVYTKCKFNDTEKGQTVKQLVEHGDVDALSIYANNLQQNGGDVTHGSIREVSLVLAGANPGAYIDTILSHGDGSLGEGFVYGDKLYSNLQLIHGDDDYGEDEEMTPEEYFDYVFESMDPDQQEQFDAFISALVDDGSSLEHSAEEFDPDEFEAVFETMTPEQQELVMATAEAILENADEEVYELEDGTDIYEPDEEVEYDLDDLDLEDEYEYEGDDEMKHNVFDMNGTSNDDVLMHSAMDTIITDAKSAGSMKESFLAHADEYGITQIDWLYPQDHELNTTPEFIGRKTDWVSMFMSGVHHTPFARIRSRFADITEDAARAKGYLKGNRKKEEVFTLLKRSTSPTTVYKKQKLDRDDIVDITDFDVVSWLKTEMRMMLDEEIARAALVGDGRSTADEDHIDETHIRPIWKEDDLFCIKKDIEVKENMTSDEKAKAVIRAALKARKDYKGSGNPVLFTTEEQLTDLLLIEDINGRDIYDSVEKLATKMRVSKIVTVPVMEGLERKDDNNKRHKLIGIIVNLSDYTIGADKGGSVNMFEDFDIDYNQQKYLIETRCSGALTKPYSAIVLEEPYPAIVVEG